MAQVIVDKDKCKGCELCVFYCPSKCFQLSSELNKRGVLFPEIKKGVKCVGCGICFLMCPDTCIEVHKDSV